MAAAGGRELRVGRSYAGVLLVREARGDYLARQPLHGRLGHLAWTMHSLLAGEPQQRIGSEWAGQPRACHVAEGYESGDGDGCDHEEGELYGEAVQPDALQRQPEAVVVEREYLERCEQSDDLVR